MSIAEYAHIALNENGTPIVVNTSTKVVEIVAEHVAWGWGAEQIRRQHPHLSMGQIHSALGFYYDHRSEMDAELKRRDELAAVMQSKIGPGPVTEKLKASGR